MPREPPVTRARLPSSRMGCLLVLGSPSPAATRRPLPQERRGRSLSLRRDDGCGGAIRLPTVGVGWAHPPALGSYFLGGCTPHTPAADTATPPPWVPAYAGTTRDSLSPAATRRPLLRGEAGATLRQAQGERTGARVPACAGTWSDKLTMSASPRSLQRRPSLVPGGGLLVGVAGPQDRLLLEVAADDVQADGQPLRGGPARH